MILNLQLYTSKTYYAFPHETIMKMKIGFPTGLSIDITQFVKYFEKIEKHENESRGN